MLSAIVEVCCGFHLRPYKRWRRTLSRTLRRAIEGPSRSSFFGVTIFFLLPFRLFRKRRKRADCWAASSSSFFGVWWTVSFEFIFFVVKGATWPLSFDLIFFFLYFSFFFFFRGIFSLQNPPPSSHFLHRTNDLTILFFFRFVLSPLHNGVLSTYLPLFLGLEPSLEPSIWFFFLRSFVSLTRVFGRCPFCRWRFFFSLIRLFRFLLDDIHWPAAAAAGSLELKFGAKWPDAIYRWWIAKRAIIER